MRGLAVVVGFLAATAAAHAQTPEPAAVKAAAQTPTSPWAAPAKLPEVKAPEVKVPDYFGPSLNQQFGEKSLFPNQLKLDVPPPGPPATQPPAGLLPPPDAGPPVVIPDGSLPTAPPPRKWRGGFEFGLNGADGNSDILSLRLGTVFDAKVERNALHVDALYTLSRQDGSTKQNQAILNVRDEILFPGSPWSVFSAVQVEYDEFRSYDLRAGAYAGFSYRWLKTDTTLFKTRLGAGAVREIDTGNDGPPDRWVPEAVIGGDFNHRLNDRQSFLSGLDVFPNLSQLGQYRVRARAGYEIVLSPEHGMVLRLGVQDRYDTSPGTAKRNDVNYFTTLLFRF
ncbi:MAG: DUF481 domain-containing protein [Gemmataceae bacterium]